MGLLVDIVVVAEADTVDMAVGMVAVAVVVMAVLVATLSRLP